MVMIDRAATVDGLRHRARRRLRARPRRRRPPDGARPPPGRLRRQRRALRHDAGPSAGYREALAAVGVEPDADPGATGPHPRRRRAPQVVLDLLGSRRPPTAVFAANPRAAIGVAHALHTTDRADVAFVSFGDFPLATHPRPRASPSSTRTRRRSGSAAMDRVLARLGRRGRGPLQDVFVDAVLVCRAAPARSRRPHDALSGWPPTWSTTSTAAAAKIAALRGIETTSPRQPEEWIAATVTRSGDGTRRAGPHRTTATCCATWWPPTRPAGSAARRAARRGPAPPTPACWSSCSTPVSGCPCTSTRTGGSRRATWTARTARPRPGSSCTATATARSTSAGATTSTRTSWRGPGTRRTASGCSPACNRVEVRAGDGVLVPAGTAHAIGEGVFLAEVQEPTDFSILLEWSVTTSTRDDSHLGVGFDVAMRAVSCRGLGGDDLARLVRHVAAGSRAPEPRPCLPGAADAFFRLDLVPGTDGVVPGRPGLRRGAGPPRLRRARLGRRVGCPCAAATCSAVPASTGDWDVVGDVEVLVARPGAGWPATLTGEGR